MSDSNVDLVKGMYAAFQRGDIGQILGVTAPDANWESYGNPAHFPTLGVHKGQSGVKEFFGKVGAALEFSEFNPQEYYASGDTVIALGHFAAKAKNTGKSASAHFAHVFTFKNGRLVKFREYTDTAAFAEAYRG